MHSIRNRNYGSDSASLTAEICCARIKKTRAWLESGGLYLPTRVNQITGRETVRAESDVVQLQCGMVGVGGARYASTGSRALRGF